MSTESHIQRSRGQRGSIATMVALHAAIKTLDNLMAGRTSSVKPAKAVFGSVSSLLITIRDSVIEEPDCVELGLVCTNICRELDRRMSGRKLDELCQSVYDAIYQSALIVADIHKNLVKWGGRNMASRLLYARSNKKMIAAWESSLDKILQALNEELAINPNVTSSTVHHGAAGASSTASDVRNNAVKTTPAIPRLVKTSASTPNVRSDAMKTSPVISAIRSLTRTSASVSNIRDDSRKTSPTAPTILRPSEASTITPEVRNGPVKIGSTVPTIIRPVRINTSATRNDSVKTSPTVSAIRRFMGPSTSTSDARNNAVNTPTIVLPDRDTTPKSPKDTRGQRRAGHASAPENIPSPPPKTPVSQTHRRVVDTNVMVREIRSSILKAQQEAAAQHRPTEVKVLGEFPPPPPRIFFGRDELIEEIVDLAENHNPIALTGTGGIGKTSVALVVLHHDRIKQQFGIDRRFLQCDEFPTSFTQFLRRLSTVIGAGIEDLEDLAPLRGFLSSKKMVIVLDNAESILDPSGTDAQKIYEAVEELGRFNNICVCITSHISTTPPDSKRLDVPTLWMDPACDTFYAIFGNNDRSDQVNGILEELDFHPLCVTLLATVARQNMWDIARLVEEWRKQRTRMLRTPHYKSLAAVIELSLACPMFQRLGPNARALLRITAFLPQGVNENNINWLFLTTPDATNVFDKLCVLSLAYRRKGFITMLAPLRDHFSPDKPESSSLLRTIKERYFTWISVSTDPDVGGSRWITLEDTNVGHLLDVFTTIDASPEGFWNACAMRYLSRHRRRFTALEPKIEELPDGRWSEPECFRRLSRSFHPVRNFGECKRLLNHALRLRRERGFDDLVARISMEISHINHHMDLHKEGIELERGALDILERLDDRVGQAQCLVDLALWWEKEDQPDLAEEAASRAISLLPENGRNFLACESHGVLGSVYQSKGDTEKAIHHFEVVLRIAPFLNLHDHLFWAHYCLAELFLFKGRTEDAHVHAEQAKLHVTDSPYDLSCAMELHAWVWYDEERLEEARSEAQCAADAYDELGAAEDVKDCRRLLQWIEEDLANPDVSRQLGHNSRGTKWKYR